MTLPEVRARLRELAETRETPSWLAAELHKLADETVRRRPVQAKRDPGSRRMSPEIETQIKTLRDVYPLWSQAQIAREVGVNSGRVSEVLHGFRE